MILWQRVFFYIKFDVSRSPSYCWAIRPPPSFSFFLGPFSLHPHSRFISPFSACSHSLFLSLSLSFCLYPSLCLSGCISLPLPPSSLFISHFVSPLRLSLSLSLPLSEGALVADGSRALFFFFTASQFPSQAGHTLLALVADCPQLPENKHTEWFPARGFVFEMRWRERVRERERERERGSEGGRNRGFM